jgi:hypothetical protein
MLRRLTGRLSYSNVMATLGVFIALGGSAYAVNTVNSSDIVDGQVKSVDIGDGEIGSADVKDNSLNTFDVHSFLGVDIVDGTLTGADVANESLTTSDIQNNSLGNGDFLTGSVDDRVATDNSLTGADVANDSLTGADVDEATLGTVPSSVLGGLGRSGLRQNGQTGPGSCDPESHTFINCDMVATLTVSRPARVLVIGSVRATTGNGNTFGLGSCRLGTTGGVVPGTTTDVRVENVGTFAVFPGTLTISGVTGVFPAGQHAFGIDCNEDNITYPYTDIAYDQARVTAVALSDQ